LLQLSGSITFSSECGPFGEPVVPPTKIGETWLNDAERVPPVDGCTDRDVSHRKGVAAHELSIGKSFVERLQHPSVPRFVPFLRLRIEPLFGRTNDDVGRKPELARDGNDDRGEGLVDLDALDIAEPPPARPSA
jgi:hypothetical protein